MTQQTKDDPEDVLGGPWRLVGWVPWDGDKPYKAERHHYISGKPQPHPPRIYSSQARAQAQSPDGTARAVYVGEP